MLRNRKVKGSHSRSAPTQRAWDRPLCVPPFRFAADLIPEAKMIKLVYCITKKPDLTDEQFFDYWKTVHARIAARIPHLRRLVQSHRLTVPGDKHHPDFDGMAELWFDNATSLLAARQSPEWQAITEDEANFIYRAKVAYFVSEEHTILDKAK